MTAPRPRRVGRVLRALLRKQSGGAEQDEQQCWGEVCGSSYDSLISLDETCAAEAVPPTTQQQQQLEQPYHHEAPPTTTPAQQQQQPQQQPQQDGMLRRCVKAVLRPVVKAVCRAARALAANAGPQGPGTNDHTRAERIINVLTSLPFFAVGLHGLRYDGVVGMWLVDMSCCALRCTISIPTHSLPTTPEPLYSPSLLSVTETAAAPRDDTLR